MINVVLVGLDILNCLVYRVTGQSEIGVSKYSIIGREEGGLTRVHNH